MRFLLERIRWEAGSAIVLAPSPGHGRFLWMRSGSVWLNLGSRRVECSSHSLICANSSCTVQVRQPTEGLSLETEWVSFPEDSGDGTPPSFRQFRQWIRRDAAVIAFPYGARAELELLFERVARAERTRPQLFWTTARLTLDELILLTYQQWVASEGGKEEAPLAAVRNVVDAVRGYIDVHFHEPLGLQRLADHAGYSASYLSSMFHRVTGQRIVEYITQQRIGHAKHLLTTSGLKVLEVGLASGFRDLAHFNRTFRRTVGTTPGGFRRANQDGETRPVLVELPSGPPLLGRRGLREFFVPAPASQGFVMTVCC